MDIGSAKIRKEEMQGVKHYLVDVLEPEEEFHIVKFQDMAKAAMEEIYAKGKLPILVGGTGFYIQAVTRDIDFTEAQQENTCRAELEKLAEEKGAEYLHECLREVDPASAEAIHANNVKRVIRALEFYHLNGTPISFSDFKEAMAERKKNAETLLKDSIDPRLITLTYVRGGVTDTLNMRVDSAYLMGVTACLVTDRLLPMVKKEYTFFESFPAGVSLGVKTLKGYVGNMKYLFSKEGAKQLGGFGTIGSIFPATWDWHQFWYMTAFLSIILAFMNILPIPALDGGHVLFLFYEMIARRKPSDKFMEYAQMTGMILLFGLLIWANFNDILRFFF